MQRPHTLFKQKCFVFLGTAFKTTLNKMNINYRLTLLLMCSFHNTICLQRPHPPTMWICHNFNCHINERKSPKTCLTNHKGSISHQIMPLVINSLRGGHIHTHASILTLQTKAISRNQAHASQRPERAWFKNNNQSRFF